MVTKNMPTLTTLNEADPFEYNRLYGPEKYGLDNMELNSVNMPDVVASDHFTSEWSDRIRTEWDAALATIKSTHNGDAFFAGVSASDLLAFAKLIAKAVNFEHKVTGVRVVRFTHHMSGYPVLRLDIASGGRRKPRSMYGDRGGPKFYDYGKF